MPVEGVDVLVSNKAVDGKTLAELAQMPETRGVFLRKITRGATATDIPILPNTTIQRGDLLPSSAARRTPTPPSSCWASPIARPTSPTWRSSARRS